MAITEMDVRVFAEVHRYLETAPLEYPHEVGAARPSLRMLELGAANWYGDARPPEGSTDAWDASDRFFAGMGIERAVCIDLHDPRGKSETFDLNYAVARPWMLNFGVVYNSGTAEHVFDVANVMRIAHECCAVNGVMVHNAPLCGWVDHGFYSLSPTLFRDLAKANGYKILSWWVGELGRWCLPIDESDTKFPTAANTMQVVAMIKTHGGEFVVPRQCAYATDTPRVIVPGGA